MKNNFHLESLDIEMKTEVELNGGVILPLFFKASNITQSDVNFAISFLNKDKLSSKKQNKTSISDFKKIDIINKTDIEFGFDLEYDCFFNKEHEKQTIERLFKFVDINILNTYFDFNFKSYLDLYNYLIDIGLDFEHIEKLTYVVSVYINIIYKRITNICRKMFKLDNKKDEEYSFVMFELQACYEDMKVPYFPENKNKTMQEWSYREREILRCYKTKKTMIDNAIHERITKKN
jgi:hypothetical protein